MEKKKEGNQLSPRRKEEEKEKADDCGGVKTGEAAAARDTAVVDVLSGGGRRRPSADLGVLAAVRQSQRWMDESFTLYVHHGGHFSENYQEYVGGDVGIVDGCDPDKWSKVEIESICKDFGYTCVSRLWYTVPGEDDQEGRMFHLIKDDKDAMFMTGLVGGHGDIHVYVQHPVHEPILVNNGNGVTLDLVVEPEPEPEGRPGKEPVVEEPQGDGAVTTDSNESSSDTEMKGTREMNPNQRYVGEDSSDSWDNDVEVEATLPNQMGAGVVNSDYTSEELLSLTESSSSGDEGVDDSDSEGDGDAAHGHVDNVTNRKKFPVFKQVSNPEHMRFEKNMLFISPKQFKDAITEYAVNGGWGVKFVKNDKLRVRAKCQPPCKFTAYLAKLPREMSYQLKTLNLEHTCTRSYKNPRCTTKFLARKLMKKVRRQPNIKLKDIQEAVHEKYVVNINAGKASRAREKAQEFVDGSYIEQYNQLWDYCAELRRSSPGSTVLMKTHTYNEGDLAAEMDLQIGVPYFERLYICWAGLVEAETKDSWTWFINLLLADIGDSKRWTFISDQQKGLVQSFADNWPLYEHRCCCRHLYNNLRKHHPGLLIRELFWRAAKATYAQEFERAMNEMKDIDEGAYFWLKGHTTTIWARHMFKGDGLSDTVLNNMCESFNSRIIKFRGKPIISMLEDIRLYLMNRSQQNRLSILKVESELCPKVCKRLHREKMSSSKWLACWSSNTKFEVKNGLQSFIVDLEKRTCTCRKWDITGIPCCHAISCIFFNREAAEKYTNDCYKVSTYKACYEPIIDPINGQNMWTPTGLPPVQPPIKRRPPGRPKKKRAREPNEPRRGHSKGLGIAKRCKSCGKIGHNKRSCKGEVGGNSSLPTAAGGGPNSRSSSQKQTTNGAHVGGVGGATGGVAINEPNPPRVPPTTQAGSSAATTRQATSSAPPNSTTSNPSKNTHGNPKKRKKGSVTSETLNASRNASRLTEVAELDSIASNVVLMSGEMAEEHEDETLRFQVSGEWVFKFQGNGFLTVFKLDFGEEHEDEDDTGCWGKNTIWDC
nr:hypothetical protein CFP56_59200 [Quercus suber]